MPEVFICRVTWSGAAKGPTSDLEFSRDLEVAFPGAAGWHGGVGAGDLPPSLPVSSAPAYKGDARRLNPELLIVSAVSSCQALTYLYIAARSGIVVVAYADNAEGRLALVDGRMRMSQITLRPTITLASSADEERARAAVEKAHAGCFVANSLTSKVTIEPTFAVAPTAR
jgi:organic hydroperoxide reductase OsmC/OhrA